MSVQIVFETHSTSVDNEANIASGWLPSKLSATGREQASALGERHRNNGFAAVIASDLGRVIETVRIAFGGTDLPIFYDWRLRECDYGDLTGSPTSLVKMQRRRYLDRPHPKGESWRDATARTARVLEDLGRYWDGKRVLLIGSSAQRFALGALLGGEALETSLGEGFDWKPGWDYGLPTGWKAPA